MPGADSMPSVSPAGGQDAAGAPAAAAPDAIPPSLRSALADNVPSRSPSPAPPATSSPVSQLEAPSMVLELADGTQYQGVSFGAEGKSISGECVFQTLSLIHI